MILKYLIIPSLPAMCLLNIQLIAQQQVTGFTLVDAATDQDIRTLAASDTIHPGTGESSLAIRADTDPSVVGSVVFSLNGSRVRTESAAPYAFSGDQSGNYTPMDLPAGDHLIEATPFSESGGAGTAGTSLSLRLHVKDGSGTPALPGGPASPPADSGSGQVTVTGELRQWHKVTLNVDGPLCSESDEDPNPFLDIRLEALFTKDTVEMKVPGYFAADGDAANTGATTGNMWRVHFAPPDTGNWQYTLSMRIGRNVAVMEQDTAGESLPPADGTIGSIQIVPSDKTGRDLRAHGLLQYVGAHYLKFGGSGKYFLKQGADAPENFLAYQEFDGNFKSDGIRDHLIKDWGPHVEDWNQGDPTWDEGKGKGIIGAVNYLASEGMNVFSFLPMNIGGDDRNVFPYTSYHERYHMDVSRLDQWEIVFEHGTKTGMYLHFKTQETENETLLDGGDLGIQRKLYYRELIARFSHHPALNWNLGEEINEQTLKQRQEMAQYFWTHDPYRHHIVIHNGRKPDDMLGDASLLTGFSLQTNRSDFGNVHSSVLEWVNKSANAGKPWVVACDEPGDAQHALVPDADDPTHDNARKNALWGTLMAGGAGNEWYFGYRHEESDLTCQDFRSRDLWWDQCRIALDFFNEHIPFWELKNHNELTTGDYCFANPGELYLVYLKNGGNKSLDLQEGVYDIYWFNPRSGGELLQGEPSRVEGPGNRNLGVPPLEIEKDWVVLVKKNTEGATGSDDATLLSLTPSTGSLFPPFNPMDTAYSLALPEGRVSVILNASPSDENASVEGAGNYDASDGNAEARIVVVSRDETRTRTYTVQITAIPLSADVTLSGLAVSAGTLEPEFNPETTGYSLVLPEGTSTVHITASSNHPRATVEGNGMIDVSSGSAEAAIEVTAEDGITSRIYSVSIMTEFAGRDETGKSVVEVYPNLASNRLFLTGTVPSQTIMVIDQNGSVLIKIRSEKSREILDLSRLDQGLYMIVVRNGRVYYSKHISVLR